MSALSEIAKRDPIAALLMHSHTFYQLLTEREDDNLVILDSPRFKGDDCTIYGPMDVIGLNMPIVVPDIDDLVSKAKPDWNDTDSLMRSVVALSAAEFEAVKFHHCDDPVEVTQARGEVAR